MLMIFFTSSLAFSMMSLIVVMVASSATVSPIPIDMPQCSSQWLTVSWQLLISRRVWSGPCSIQVTCTRPPPVVPRLFLHSTPVSSSPRRMSTCESSRDRSGVSPSLYHAEVRLRLMSGRNMEKICLPVHSGRGLSRAGMGTVPSHSSMFISTFISRSFSMNVSRFSISLQPSSVSCTIPMTGLLACGDTMFLGTIISSRISARVSCVCATCMFISSPSKSAL
mmetsp:Transcript_745/g.1999  ORF Transcript_745/g.1999 Transcript_745/m.1999 type:complete len:223 (+) Transcript_745:1173-1841(+)